MMQEHESRVVIGLDIGGGNVTAYISIINNGGDPTPTKALQEEQEASIFARFGDGRDCWGNGVLEMTADELAEAQCLKANFKAPPEMGNDGDMTAFAQMVLKTIRNNTHEFYGLKPVWIIGCPSSWPQLDKRAKEKYAALFRKAGMEDIIICEESTAAVSYYDRALKVVTKDNTSKGVLLVDWGSTTLDATFILPPEDGMMKRVETSGCALGAHFIDKAIVCAVLYKQKDYGLEQLRNDEELTQKVRRKYEQDEAFRSLLDCHAKILKETYFRAMALPGLKPKRTQLRWKETVNLSMETSEWGEGETFYTLGISIQMMEDILSEPIREVVSDFDSYNEFTQNDIGYDSFIRRNERFLEELHDRYTEYARTQDALIMLTGGASQMDFIRRSVSACFPNHKIDYDNHPELSIGKGLAYYGREALQNQNWKELIEKEAAVQYEMKLADEGVKDSVDTDLNHVEPVSIFKDRFNKITEEIHLWHEKFCLDFINIAIDNLMAKVRSVRETEMNCYIFTDTYFAVEHWRHEEFEVSKEKAAKALVEKINSCFKYLSVNLFFDKRQEINWMDIFDVLFDTLIKKLESGRQASKTHSIISGFIESIEGKSLIKHLVEAHWEMVTQKLRKKKFELLSEIKADIKSEKEIHFEEEIGIGSAYEGEKELDKNVAYKENRLSESWRENIKNELREEMIEEFFATFRKVLCEVFQETFSKEVSEAFEESFFCKMVAFHQGYEFVKSINFSKFKKGFDNIKDANIVRWEKLYNTFVRKSINELHIRQWRLGEETENILKKLQEKTVTDLIEELNDTYRVFLYRYGITCPLFDEGFRLDWVYISDQDFKRALYYWATSSAGIIIDSIVSSLIQSMETRLEQRKYELIFELEQMDKAGYVNRQR